MLRDVRQRSQSGVVQGAGYLERETFNAFLKLPAPQRKIIREVILAFARAHADAEVQSGKPQA